MTASKAEPTDIQVSVSLPAQKRLVHPAQHFDRASGQVFFGFSLPVSIDDGKGSVNEKDTPCLVNNKGETIPCLRQTLLSNGVTLSAEPEWSDSSRNRMSVDILASIMQKGGTREARKMTHDVGSLFAQTRQVFSDLVWLRDDRWYDYLTLWTLGTYCFSLFCTYPHVYLWGPRGSAKTKIMTVVSYIGFNAELSPSLSPASLFRTVESCRATLLLDEMEKIGDKDLFADLRSMLLSGYKRDATVKRTESDSNGGHRQRRFQVYSPKMIANIDGIDQTLQDRCVTLNTQRLSGNQLRRELRVIANRSVTTTSRISLYSQLRDSCYVVMIDNWQEIDRLYEEAQKQEDNEDATARHLELWQPIFTLAQFFESFADSEPSLAGLEERMHALLVDVIEEYRLTESDSNEHTLVKTLWRMAQNLKEEDMILVSYTEVRQDWAKFLSDDIDEDSTPSIPSWMSGKFLGKMLRKVGFRKKDLVRHGRGWHVRLTKKKLQDMIEFFDVDIEDEGAPPKVSSPCTLSTQSTLISGELSEPNALSERAERGGM